MEVAKQFENAFIKFELESFYGFGTLLFDLISFDADVSFDSISAAFSFGDELKGLFPYHLWSRLEIAIGKVVDASFLADIWASTGSTRTVSISGSIQTAYSWDDVSATTTELYETYKATVESELQSLMETSENVKLASVTGWFSNTIKVSFYRSENVRSYENHKSDVI